MSSTDLDAPSLRLILAAIIIVVGVHVLTAVALVAIKTPQIKIEPEKNTPPIEIEMVTLPPPPPIEVEALKSEEEKPQTTRKVDTKPKPAVASKPKAVQKPKPIENSKPLAKTKPATKPVVTSENPKTKAQPNTTKAVENEPFEHEVKRQESILTVQAAALAADNEREILAAQAEKAAQQADAKAAREAQAEAAAKKVAEVKAAKEQAEAEQAAAAEAAARKVPFTVTNGDWKNKPTFRLPDKIVNRLTRRMKATDESKTYNLTLFLSINKSGRITKADIEKSSGDRQIDIKAVSQAQGGSFHPSTNNRTGILPIIYSVNVAAR